MFICKARFSSFTIKFSVDHVGIPQVPCMWLTHRHPSNAGNLSAMIFDQTNSNATARDEEKTKNFCKVCKQYLYDTEMWKNIILCCVNQDEDFLNLFLLKKNCIKTYFGKMRKITRFLDVINNDRMRVYGSSVMVSGEATVWYCWSVSGTSASWRYFFSSCNREPSGCSSFKHTQNWVLLKSWCGRHIAG